MNFFFSFSLTSTALDTYKSMPCSDEIYLQLITYRSMGTVGGFPSPMGQQDARTLPEDHSWTKVTQKQKQPVRT